MDDDQFCTGNDNGNRESPAFNRRKSRVPVPRPSGLNSRNATIAASWVAREGPSTDYILCAGECFVAALVAAIVHEFFSGGGIQLGPMPPSSFARRKFASGPRARSGHAHDKSCRPQHEFVSSRHESD
jgi:hypothetical protein